MQVIKVGYNLQDITQTPKSALSDLFILLYSIHLLEEQGVKASILTLNKLYPFIFQRLEEKNELDELHVFNLPFYKMERGHYNKSLKNKYLAKLLETGLVEEGLVEEGEKVSSYQLKDKSKRMIRDFQQELGAKEENKKFASLVTEYVKRFIEGRSYNDVYSTLRYFSHTSLVEKKGEEISVHELPIDDNTAIAYNDPNFKEGKPSNLVPDEYLTLLGHMLQENVRPTKSSEEFVETLLSTP